MSASKTFNSYEQYKRIGKSKVEKEVYHTMYSQENKLFKEIEIDFKFDINGNKELKGVCL